MTLKTRNTCSQGGSDLIPYARCASRKKGLCRTIALSQLSQLLTRPNRPEQPWADGESLESRAAGRHGWGQTPRPSSPILSPLQELGFKKIELSFKKEKKKKNLLKFLREDEVVPIFYQICKESHSTRQLFPNIKIKNPPLFCINLGLALEKYLWQAKSSATYYIISNAISYVHHKENS